MEDKHCKLITPKQETQESLESFKEELINEEYSEEILPKLEEIIEQSASHMSNNPMQKSFVETQEDTERRKKSSHRHRCSVCLLMYLPQNMKFVTMEDDKLIIMVGCVLRGSYTLDLAQLFITGRMRPNICYVHFSEAINKIYEILNITNTDEIHSCSSILMNNLMITVNALIPKLETVQFCNIICKFVKRNISRKRKLRNTKKEENNQGPNRRCSVCTQIQPSNNLKHVSMQNEKILIMIGCILRGEYTLEQAHSFISQRKYFYICLIHFSQTTDEIYKFFNIKHPDEISSCSTDLMAKLMITVNELFPWITNSPFCHMFNEFVMRNKTFLDRVITPTEMEYEEQKPRDIILNEREIKREKEDLLESVKEEPIEDEHCELIIPKQETEELLENVKEEPIDEKFFDEIVPKDEEIIEPSALSAQPIHLTSLEQNYFMQKVVSKLDVEAERVQEEMNIEPQNTKNDFGLQNLRCSVCLQSYPRQNMKCVTMEEDKLVTMIGCFLNGSFTLDQVQLFVNGKMRLNICYVHFSEAINKIYHILNIKNTD